MWGPLFVAYWIFGGLNKGLKIARFVYGFDHSVLGLLLLSWVSLFN